MQGKKVDIIKTFFSSASRKLVFESLIGKIRPLDMAKLQLEHKKNQFFNFIAFLA